MKARFRPLPRIKTLGNKLLKLGLKPTDCITYILECMSEGNNKNYVYKKYTQAEEFSKLLKNKNFETIYIAENVTETTPEYEYNWQIRLHSYTKYFLQNIKKGNYFSQIDYLITEEDFHNPFFEKFLKKQDGFLFFQEGVHTGFLSKGDFLNCHMEKDPKEGEIYSKSNLIKKMDNDNPKLDYQSAVLFVPKGTVQNFIYENSLR